MDRDLRPAPVAQRWLTKGRGRLGRCRQGQEVRQSAQPTIRNPLRPPQCHHNPVTVPGVRLRSTAGGDLREPRIFGPWPSVAVNRRIRDGSENHGVPGSNPGPATQESPANKQKIRSSGGAARALCRGRVNSRIKNRPLLAPLTVEGRVSWAGREAVRLVGVPGEAYPGTRRSFFNKL